MSNVTPINEVARGLAEARSMSRDEIFAKMDSLLNDGDRAILAEIDVARWLLDGDYRAKAWAALPMALQEVFGTFGTSMFLGTQAVKREVFCTCGIYPTDPLSVPDPRTAWRHSLSCAHSQVRRTRE